MSDMGKLVVAGALLTFGMMATVMGSEVTEADKARIFSELPELIGSAVQPSPIEGLYEVMVGGQIIYVSRDGQYLLQGDLFDAAQEVNLTEERRAIARQVAVSAVAETDMILFSPDEVKHTVTVFTDIDCGYCRKLHRDMAGYNARGIEVRYMFYPRSGPETVSWFKAENVWCADDRNEALTAAKSGVEVAADDCESTPISEHYNLGRSLGIRGTPAIVTESGKLIPGYAAPNELLGYLEE
ncbi:MAG: DsbC family protein [Gammaproteobacteria bacterium]|nr:DsbC family protein [Gammaproteobacteria bacterium]